MAHIISKLYWTDTLKLALVSPTWLHGFRSHHVQAERASYGAGETYVVLPYYPQPGGTMLGLATISVALYSMEEDRCFELPALPPFHSTLPGCYWCACVALDCKVYVIEFDTSFQNWAKPSITSRMMAFDVAGQGGWQPCANLQRTKGYFQCGILNGKIYAVGVLSGDLSRRNSSTVTSEVYSPEDNTWSSIKPVKYSTLDGMVWALGDKRVVRRDRNEPELQHDNLDVYDPTKDEWTEEELPLLVADGSFNRDFSEKQFETFTSKGKFYIMDPRKICVFDCESGLWKYLHSSTFAEIGMGPVNSLVVLPMKVMVVEGELVAIVQAKQTNGCASRKLILRSRSRLGGDNREIVWQRANTDAIRCLKGCMGGALRI